MNFKEKLTNIAAEACESEGLVRVISELLDTMTSLIVFSYIKTNLKGYDDFKYKINEILGEEKIMLLEKYQTALREEL